MSNQYASPGFTDDTLGQRFVRGPYEHLTTDTARLAGNLFLLPQDFMRLTRDFDAGHTSLRDVGGMSAEQRAAILSGNVDVLFKSRPNIFNIPVKNLHDRVVAGARDQPVGHNFFVNATGFIDAGLPWAIDFDNVVHRLTGASVADILQLENMQLKDQILTAITNHDDPTLKKILAVYLAGRSLAGEKYLEQKYGLELNRAKQAVYAETQEIGRTTGLRNDMLERAKGQLQRVTFGSFDHLKGLVTTSNTGAAGDYVIGSLRVEVQFDGSVLSAQLRDSADAYHILAHEVDHASSAQDLQYGRCGLQMLSEGLEANEGMTEYVAQRAIGSPGIKELRGGGVRVEDNVFYANPVRVMLFLHLQFMNRENDHFATLFNAYHGDVRSRRRLEHALDVFYYHNINLANRRT